MRGVCPRCRLPSSIRSALKITARELSPSSCALWNTGRNSEGKEAAEAEAEGEGPQRGEEPAEAENAAADAAAAVAARLAVIFAHQETNETSQWTRNIRGKKNLPSVSRAHHAVLPAESDARMLILSMLPNALAACWCSSVDWSLCNEASGATSAQRQRGQVHPAAASEQHVDAVVEILEKEKQ